MFDGIFDDAPTVPEVRRCVRVPQVNRGVRMSLLPVARYCPKAAGLSEQYGAGRPAAMSQAFHAKAAGEPNWPDLWARLDDAERETVDSWTVPSDVDLGNGVLLRYQDAAKEVELRIVTDGWESIGHMDLGWVVQHGDSRVAYPADMKKTPWTTLDGPTSLQLIGYGLAFAVKNNCSHFVPGLWIIETREWRWHTRMFDVSEPGLWRDVKAAMSNVSGEARTGAHCRDCWGRFHCGEHLLPAALADTELAPLVAPGGLTKENALRALLRYQALSDLVGDGSPVRDALTEFAKRHGGISDPATGKVWAPVRMPGRESANVKKLRADLGSDAEPFIKKGGEYSQMRWVKP